MITEEQMEALVLDEFSKRPARESFFDFLMRVAQKARIISTELQISPTQGADDEVLPGTFDNAEDLIAALQGADVRPVAMTSAQRIAVDFYALNPHCAQSDFEQRLVEANASDVSMRPVACYQCGGCGDNNNAPGQCGRCKGTCVEPSASPADHSRDAVIEECAAVCHEAENGFKTMDRKQTASYLAAMIRALKSQQDAAIESQRSGDGE